jgi:hypothetical protein
VSVHEERRVGGSEVNTITYWTLAAAVIAAGGIKVIVRITIRRDR